jgi:hypothetical protein
LADSEEVSDVEGGSVDGWLAANGLREAHPEAIDKTEPTKIIKVEALKARISKRLNLVETSCELDSWPRLLRGIAAFTGGP